MKKYSELMEELSPKGNYVSVGVTELPTNMVSYLPGKITPEPHITIMYSPSTDVDHDKIQYVLNRRKMNGSRIMVTGVEVFDTTKEDSTEPMGCIVLRVNSPELNDLHNHLTRLGCVYTHEQYKPHATLIYNCPLEQCKIAVKEIEHAISHDGVFLTCTNFTNEQINKDWEKSD